MDAENPNNYYTKLASENVCDGVQYEPRLWWDQFDFAAGGINTSFGAEGDGPFYNGEEYPVRITHLTAAMAIGETLSPDPAPVQGDPRLIQRFGMHVEINDAFYQNERFVPLPLWHNVRVGGAPVISPAISSIRFPRSFPLGQRQSFVVDVELEQVPDSARDVAISFEGVGRTSKRPYRFASVVSLSTTASTQFSPLDLRSEGVEVVDVHSMTLSVSAPIEDNDAAGDIRQMRLRIRQTGNGTQSKWDSGAIDSTGAPLPAPGVLWGTHIGRAIVHELPMTSETERGWLVQPGQGFKVRLQNFDTTRQETVAESVWVGFVGYVVIT